MTKQEAEKAYREGDITYAEFKQILEELGVQVGKISDKADRTHVMVTDLYQSLRPSMSELVRSNQEAAATLKEMRADQRDNTALIAGKQQVPMKIFLLVVAIMALLLLIEKVHFTGTGFEFSPSKFEVKPVDGGANDPSRPTPQPVR